MVFLLFPNTLFDIKYLDKTKEYILYEHPLFFSHKCRSLLYHKNKLLLTEKVFIRIIYCKGS